MRHYFSHLIDFSIIVKSYSKSKRLINLFGYLFGYRRFLKEVDN